jgi:hypothetical protein
MDYSDIKGRTDRLRQELAEVAEQIGNISAERITREKNKHNIGYFRTESV